LCNGLKNSSENRVQMLSKSPLFFWLYWLVLGTLDHSILQGSQLTPQPITDEATNASTATEKLPALPFPITSFGAVRHGGSIYVYGGNMGSAHGYYDEGQNNKLMQLDLARVEKGWQELSTNQRLQGLGMVAWENKLILVGGFSARNAKGEKQDLHSQANTRVFDLKSGQWSELPALPEPRSSHDAALIGSTIYVVGGWKLEGEGKTTWHSNAWSMDLAQPSPIWTELTKPNFVRRAVAVVAHHGKLFVIGGMDEDGKPTKAASCYDPVAKVWNELEEIPGDVSMAGFGAAAWSVDGKLIVSTYEGLVLSWNDNSKSWINLGKTVDARFFHRLLPLKNGKLVSLGGANMDSGKFVELEVISVN
jgi:N-acetylneuraminic acid mutarotase